MTYLVAGLAWVALCGWLYVRRIRRQQRQQVADYLAEQERSRRMCSFPQCQQTHCSYPFCWKPD